MLGYTLGFCYCFSPSNLTHGVAEWLMLLLMQVLLIPLYAAFEAYGIVLALIAPWKKFAPMLKKFATEWFGGKKKRPSAQGETAFTGFKLVQKQGKDAAKRAAEMEAAQEAAASDAGAHWKKPSSARRRGSRSSTRRSRRWRPTPTLRSSSFPKWAPPPSARMRSASA